MQQLVCLVDSPLDNGLIYFFSNFYSRYSEWDIKLYDLLLCVHVHVLTWVCLCVGV